MGELAAWASVDTGCRREDTQRSSREVAGGHREASEGQREVIPGAEGLREVTRGQVIWEVTRDRREEAEVSEGQVVLGGQVRRWSALGWRREATATRWNTGSWLSLVFAFSEAP